MSEIKNPLKLASSPLTERVYAFRSWKRDGNAIVATGHREDITDEFRREMNNQLRQWVDAGYVEVTKKGAPILNEFFGLRESDQ